jgi:hypothetical protein
MMLLRDGGPGTCISHNVMAENIMACSNPQTTLATIRPLPAATSPEWQASLRFDGDM